jgi:DNA-binding LacI/PurR family transcriptional regulator
LAEKQAGRGTLVLSGRKPVLSGHRFIVFMLCAGEGGADRFNEPFQAKLFFHLERRCADMGYHLIYKTAGPGDHAADVIRGLDVSCLVFSSYLFDHLLTQAAEMRIPVLVANNYHPKYSSVQSDDYNAARELAEHFIATGHRRIGVITGPEEFITSRERFRGCLAALGDHSFNVKDMPVFEGDWTFSSGFEAGNRIARLSGPRRPDGIFAFNDEMAMGAIQAFRLQGIEVPGDISVAGFDDIEAGDKAVPALTTVHVDIPTMAAVLSHQLYITLELPGEKPVVQIRVPVSPVIRDTVADRRGRTQEAEFAEKTAR